MDNKTKTTVRICGSDYTLVGTESEEYIQRVCLYVDKKMRSIATNPTLNKINVAVLSAINMGDEYFKMKDMQEETAAELKKYKEDYFSAYNAGKRLKDENHALKEEIQNLKIKIAKLEGSR
ncbi:MAG: cell division protein ZapA [Ruminococcaceae bacterium]|nr:cell division protein ZapA [Oscillospiraceae bacterium]